MTKPADSTNPSVHKPAPEALQEVAARAEILFDHPNMVPGRSPRGLSPREMIKATCEPRADQVQDPQLFMTETPLNAIDKDGIDVLKKTYTGLELLPLTTGGKNRLRRDLVMRYNRAELARGVLKEIVILERDRQGAYSELGRAARSDLFGQDTDYSVFLRERAAYIERLVNTVKLDTEQLLRIETGTSNVEELVNAIHARERFQRRARPKPIVSKPRWDDGHRPSTEAEADYETMKQKRPEAASSGGGGGVPAELRLADVITGADALGETRKPQVTRGSRKKKVKRASTRRSAAGKTAPPPEASGGDNSAASHPLAGGSAGLADLLSTAPVRSEDHS